MEQIKQDSLQNKIIRNFFEATVFMKGAAGILEIAMGSLFLFLNKETIDNVFIFLTNLPIVSYSQHLTNYLERQADVAQDSQYFLASYFLFYGLLNIFLVVCLLKDKLWAYPTSIVFFSAFNLYLLYRFLLYRSGTTLFFVIFDIFFIILIWREYWQLQQKKTVSTI